MSNDKFREESLQYHKARNEFDTNGKIGTLITKPCDTEKELSMAYSPGVAYPCLEIEKDEEAAYEYTNKGNLVAVISDGTAVLGLGDIGHLAGKPVMEGKAVLFKTFANVDAVDIEINTKDTDEIIETVARIADSFGGVNLEDISAPRCFEIEARLKEICNVPVFHDDQHGTAVITTAGLINVLEMTGKKPEDLKVVVIGAGASGIACARMYKQLGVKNITMLDSKGVIHSGRTDLNKYKQEFAFDTPDRTLEDAMKGADMVLGLSGPDLIKPEWVKTMSKESPIIFACANPNPEIKPELAKEARPDIIIGTGRSDYPNQVNNVLGFPQIFRGALDVRATRITENMKMAASKALAALAKEPVPEHVKKAQGRETMEFGPDYIIPSPFDRRVLVYVASAVAQAAVEDGVARVKEFDLDAYKAKLQRLADHLDGKI
ncbi:malic enzyme-like NAD(P)-binding protein [Nitratifractor salsuginis]|uniref:Malic protein NAD-binding protein n=1 Tax=Nitratifractor salsuginis (strain DSM 16511 / JCM 12458 / E9I37-1) TaxID=749222 RepID=E6WYT0_NITSE|nr:malic enzyme-like NAD(P)-binding protein [Nitratifractor salsuginis]ADV46516.1 malic protein NAD-binding protein [Nitratifractor salsuginis DSM 16511]